MNPSSLLCILSLVLGATWAAPQMQSTLPLHPADSVPADLVPSADLRREGPYAFGADKVDRHTALAMFAAANGLRLMTEYPLDGALSIEFRDKNLQEALDLLLKDTEARWTLEGNLLRIHAPGDAQLRPTTATTGLLAVEKSNNTRVFRIDYPRLKRSGSGSSAARVSTSGSGEAGNVTLATTDELLFWDEIEGQLKTILGDASTLVINRLSGTLFAQAPEDRLDMAQNYLEIVVTAATRQVEITARIYEVTLNDDRSLGIDWSRVDEFTVQGAGFSLNTAADVIQTGPAFKASTLALDLSRDNNNLAVMLRALKEQGEMQAVSQPRVVTLNNQPAMVKVGTDMPYFSATVTTNATTGAREVQEMVSVVTVGVVLSVTPQISGDGWITLGIDPMISDLVSTVVSSYGSTAPMIDIKQSSTLVRLRDRETVRISGLLQNKEQSVQRKIPLLGDIPLLGALFRWEYKTKTRKELVIFLTPRIL